LLRIDGTFDDPSIKKRYKGGTANNTAAPPNMGKNSAMHTNAIKQSIDIEVVSDVL